ncbi:unnamed protein product [Protopolystoma xenopodis]|uniref:Uncharacterized protein n=1 Tax=Protopolystoma xenopodis TaxID=117903 RepID=A0A3S5CKC3_9PLAT|nr:unnamed protein product [Protopolystoma xenopodis]
MARLTDDAGETSGNVPRPRSEFGNDHAYNWFRARNANPVDVELPTRLLEDFLLALTQLNVTLLVRRSDQLPYASVMRHEGAPYGKVVFLGGGLRRHAMTIKYRKSWSGELPKF